jgi:tetratricopeptide (TPR) repeat protein
MADADEPDDGRPDSAPLGALARQGVAREREIDPDDGDSATAAWREAVRAARDAGAGVGTGEPVDDGWLVVEEPPPGEDGEGDGDGDAPPPDDVEIRLEDRERRDISDAIGRPLAPEYEQRLANGARAFRAGRYADARKILAPLADRAPGSVAVRELHGLALYRLGRWKPAARELEAFADLSRSTEQHPVLADCYRALERYRRVEELWAELRASSPSAELVTEGRIVAAGGQADQGDLKAALKTLGHPGWKVPRRPKEHHLRRAYALADLYERSGDVPRARQLFGRIRGADATFGDVRARIRALD